jgi:hypothetical protein
MILGPYSYVQGDYEMTNAAHASNISCRQLPIKGKRKCRAFAGGSTLKHVTG